MRYITSLGLLWLVVLGEATPSREHGVPRAPSGSSHDPIPTVLDPVNSDHRYSFVLVRYGMTVPSFPSYENDPDYNMEWTSMQGQPTREGKSLLKMIGASLAYHYRNSLTPPVDQRSHQRMTQAWTMDDILVSASEDSLRAREFSADLRRGLFGSTNDGMRTSTVHRPYYDNSDKVKSCHHWQSLRRIFSDPRHDLSLVNDFRTSCSSRVYSLVQNFVATNPHSSWFINDPEKLYRLLEMVMFEAAQQGTWPHTWVSQISSIQACVTDYFLLFVNDKEIGELLLGQILQKMKSEYSLNSLKLHLHLTDDLTFLALSWVTRGLWQPGGRADLSRVEWPSFGDALMFDFTASTVQVTMFSPMRSDQAPSFSSRLVTPDQLFRMVPWLSSWMWEDKCRSGVPVYPGPHDPARTWYTQTPGQGGTGDVARSGSLRQDYTMVQDGRTVRKKRQLRSGDSPTSESTIYAWKDDGSHILPTSSSTQLFVYASDHTLAHIHLCDLDALAQGVERGQTKGGGGGPRSNSPGARISTGGGLGGGTIGGARSSGRSSTSSSTGGGIKNGSGGSDRSNAGGHVEDGKLILYWDGQECVLVFLTDSELLEWQTPDDSLIPHIISHDIKRS